MVKSYYPSSYNEALDILSQKEVTVMAGGTDLMVKRRSWSNLPPKFDTDVMFVNGLEELNYIDRQGHEVHIGATVTLEDILDHFHTPTLLVEAVKEMASPAIRHSATLAGNIVNASPAGDSLPVLYLLDANVVLESSYGLRHVPIQEFIVGPGLTTISNDEMVKEIVMTDYHFNHLKYWKVGSRKADTISKVCFAGAANVKKSEIVDIRMAIGAVAPTIVRNRGIEEGLIGKTVNYIKEHRTEIGQRYVDRIRPIDDQRSTADYRQQTAINLIVDFLKHL